MSIMLLFFFCSTHWLSCKLLCMQTYWICMVSVIVMMSNNKKINVDNLTSDYWMHLQLIPFKFNSKVWNLI